MPRNGAGVASAVAGSNTVSPNTTILSALENSLVNDLINMFNTQWPVAIGGSGAISGDNFASLNNSTSILNNWLKDFSGTITAGGTATGLTATTTQAFTAYGSGAGQLGNGTLLSVKTASAAAAGGTALTVSSPSSLGSKKVLRPNNFAIRTNEWASLATIQLRYDSAADSGAGAWILLNPDPTAALSANSRNHVVNPSMQVSQENGTTSGTTDAYYPVDQWFMKRVTSAGTITASQVASPTLEGSPNRVRLVVSVADASLAAGEYLYLQQNLEGSAVADLTAGTGIRATLLRLGFKGPAGTYSIALLDATSSVSYVVNFTVSIANTDATYTFAIPSSPTGTWSKASGAVGIQLIIAVAVGSTFQGVAGWQSGQFYGTSSNTNGMGTINNTFEIFDVGFYRDPLSTGVAPTYEVPDPAAELLRCARYYQKFTAGTTNAPMAFGYMQTTTNARSTFPLVAPLALASPTVGSSTIGNFTAVANGSSGAASALSLHSADANRITIDFTVAAIASSTQMTHIMRAPGSDFITVNSRI